MMLCFHRFRRVPLNTTSRNRDADSAGELPGRSEPFPKIKRAVDIWPHVFAEWVRIEPLHGSHKRVLSSRLPIASLGTRSILSEHAFKTGSFGSYAAAWFNA
jgi:hypothetical protein